MQAAHHTVHFGGQLVHPHQSWVKGEDPAGNTIRLAFTTDSNSVTKLQRSQTPTLDEERVAELHWAGTQLGNWVSKTRDGRQLPMGELANITGRPSGKRAFTSIWDDGIEANFLWVRLPNANGDTHSYNLLDERSGLRVGHYGYHGPLVSPEGVITYATFEYAFHSEELFLDAMMSLYINRFLDSIGRAI